MNEQKLGDADDLLVSNDLDINRSRLKSYVTFYLLFCVLIVCENSDLGNN